MGDALMEKLRLPSNLQSGSRDKSHGFGKIHHEKAHAKPVTKYLPLVVNIMVRIQHKVFPSLFHAENYYIT